MFETNNTVARHAVDIAILMQYESNGTNTVIVGGQTNRFYTDTNNTLTVSNMLAGFSYRVTYYPTPDPFCGEFPIVFTNSFPTNLASTNFLIYGGDPLYLTAGSSSFLYTAYQFNSSQFTTAGNVVAIVPGSFQTNANFYAAGTNTGNFVVTGSLYANTATISNGVSLQNWSNVLDSAGDLVLTNGSAAVGLVINTNGAMGMGTNASVPTPAPGRAWLYFSNYDFYLVTPTKTNLIVVGH